MLLKLSIKNYILIHDLEIDFSEGFSVITGETGAGKSILLGALSLILGQRADSGILLNKENKCIIEGLFMIRDYNLESFFKVHELDYDGSVILRREINQNGKSRAFINDTPVTLNLLKELGDKLVNVHSQNSIITLNDSDFQLAIIDSYAGIESEVMLFRLGFYRFIEMKRQLLELEEKEVKVTAEMDYFQFLLDELTQARLVSTELPEIEAKLELLTHAEEIRNSLYQANYRITGSDENILAQLTEVMHALNGVSRYKPELKNLVERINVNYIDVKDAANELHVMEEQVFVDPPLVESLTQRIDHLYRLMKKHQVSSVEQLLVIKQEIEKKVSDEENMADQLNRLRTETAKLESDLLVKSATLSLKRKKIVSEFENEVIGILTKLGIPMARFNVTFAASDSINKDGIDKVKFLFSANKGMELKDLSNTASGGELSRIMLSIKSMISQKNLLPTIIFDEIDNGVSGEVAGKVGSILKRMGDNMQVIAITHLPQIAAKGNRHYWVYKTEEKETTTTFIRQLSPQERIEEIAKMLSSETVTDSALRAAGELLRN